MGKVLVKMYLDESTLAAVDELAERESRSRSGMLGVIVRHWLTHMDTGSGPADDVFAALESVTGAGGVDLATVEQEAIKPTLDQRRAERKQRVSSSSGPSGIETLSKPHRHRFQIEVANTRHGKAGRQVADYACDCGEIKKEQPVK